MGWSIDFGQTTIADINKWTISKFPSFLIGVTLKSRKIFYSKAQKILEMLALTTAGIILDEELVQSHPASTDTHHHCRTQNTNQTKFLAVTEL